MQRNNKVSAASAVAVAAAMATGYTRNGAHSLDFGDGVIIKAGEGHTFRPRPARMGNVRKVAPGLWAKVKVKRKHKGSNAAKRASRRGGNQNRG